MPDITMCKNDKCPLSNSCYRFNCAPSKRHQSYSDFKPVIDEVTNAARCEFYIESKKTIDNNSKTK